MNARNIEPTPLPPPPPQAVKALFNGFNAVASNVAVILFPIALDVFFWMGPRLKADALLAPFMQVLPEVQSQAPVAQARLFGQMMTEFYNGFNLFSVFRTYPMGVFSLMSVNLSENSPLGPRAALGSSDWLLSFGLVLALTILGWVAGSLYFRSVARVALNPAQGPGILRAVLQGVLLSGAWVFLFALANLPIWIFMFAITLLDGLVRAILTMLLIIPASWVLLGIFFSFHGIFASAQNAFSSTRNSLRILRYGLPPLGWFCMMALVINQGLDMLWRVPPAESWMTGVGILGHAFISTSLLAASFIYYRDLNIWIESAQQWFKNQNTSSARA